jgi:hypothetical protein
MTDEFFIKKVPQSEYRGRKKASSDGPQFLDLALDDLKIKNDDICDDLKQRIIDENQRILNALLPEDRHESVLKGRYLKDIMTKLGLK